MTNANLGIPVQMPLDPTVKQSHQQHPYLQKDYSSRVNRIGERQPGPEPNPMNTVVMRGAVERKHISREEANAQIARQAAQAGAQQTLDVGALQSQVAAQAAVIAQLEANNAALAARLDALEGGAGEAA